MTQEQILSAIGDAIDEVNQQQPPSRQIGKASESPLYGENAPLDSLALVTLVVAIEQRIADRSGRALVIANEKAFSQKHSPFRSVGALAAFISTLLAEEPA